MNALCGEPHPSTSDISGRSGGHYLACSRGLRRSFGAATRSCRRNTSNGWDHSSEAVNTCWGSFSMGGCSVWSAGVAFPRGAGARVLGRPCRRVGNLRLLLLTNIVSGTKSSAVSGRGHRLAITALDRRKDRRIGPVSDDRGAGHALPPGVYIRHAHRRFPPSSKPRRSPPKCRAAILTLSLALAPAPPDLRRGRCRVLTPPRFENPAAL